ncbi:MAG TPA: hypothetical protein VGW74_08070 [Propionibacteriaceae bacterium]|nr:hypothetical protein [Propionibacteriaceae bacterium]
MSESTSAPAPRRQMPSNRDPVALAETAEIFRRARARRLAAEAAAAVEREAS